jgi:hypothetical protein
MRLDLVHPAVEKVTLVLESVGAGRVRVNSASLDRPVVVLAGEAAVTPFQKRRFRHRNAVTELKRRYLVAGP